jgi:hypothetical protein
MNDRSMERSVTPRRGGSWTGGGGGRVLTVPCVYAPGIGSGKGGRRGWIGEWNVGRSGGEAMGALPTATVPPRCCGAVQCVSLAKQIACLPLSLPFCPTPAASPRNPRGRPKARGFSGATCLLPAACRPPGSSSAQQLASYAPSAAAAAAAALPASAAAAAARCFPSLLGCLTWLTNFSSKFHYKKKNSHHFKISTHA